MLEWKAFVLPETNPSFPAFLAKGVKVMEIFNIFSILLNLMANSTHSFIDWVFCYKYWLGFFSLNNKIQIRDLTVILFFSAISFLVKSRAMFSWVGSKKL